MLFQMKDCGLMDVTVHYKTQQLEVSRCLLPEILEDERLTTLL